MPRTRRGHRRSCPRGLRSRLESIRLMARPRSLVVLGRGGQTLLWQVDILVAPDQFEASRTGCSSRESVVDLVVPAPERAASPNARTPSLRRARVAPRPGTAASAPRRLSNDELTRGCSRDELPETVGSPRSAAAVAVARANVTPSPMGLASPSTRLSTAWVMMYGRSTALVWTRCSWS